MRCKEEQSFGNIVYRCELYGTHEGSKHQATSPGGRTVQWGVPVPAEPEPSKEDPAVRCAESKAGKPRYDLIPPEVLAALARVMTFGAAKHAPDSWRTVPDGDAVYYSALMRHLERGRMGETKDEETGEHPYAHALADIVILLGRQL